MDEWLQETAIEPQTSYGKDSKGNIALWTPLDPYPSYLYFAFKYDTVGKYTWSNIVDAPESDVDRHNLQCCKAHRSGVDGKSGRIIPWLAEETLVHQSLE